jgi:hypothetical protein
VRLKRFGGVSVHEILLKEPKITYHLAVTFDGNGRHADVFAVQRRDHSKRSRLIFIALFRAINAPQPLRVSALAAGKADCRYARVTAAQAKARPFTFPIFASSRGIIQLVKPPCGQVLFLSVLSVS